MPVGVTEGRREPPLFPGGSACATIRRMRSWLVGWLGVVLVCTAGAQSNAVYRCPGPPVLYTDQLSAAEARERGCRAIEAAPVTVVQTPRPRAAASAASAPRPGEAKVDPAAQRQRDNDARRVLEAELRREEEHLAALKRDYNNGEPERLGNERNYQTYLDRVAEMRASILRSESDIAALRRELAKLPP